MLLANMKTEFELVQSDNIMTVLELGIVPRFVNTIHLEKAKSVQQSTLLLDYVLSRCFHIDSASELKMVECSNASSRMASVLHICRMGLCGEIMLLSGDDGYEHAANKLVSISRECKNVNIICPMISDTRRMAMRKPNSLRAAVDPGTGDITVGVHLIPQTVWSDIIPRVQEILSLVLDRVLEGDHWKKIEVFSASQSGGKISFSWRASNSPSCDESDIKLSQGATDRDLEILSTIIRFIFHGLCCGSLRFTEIGRVRSSQVRVLDMSNLFFYSSSLKQYDSGHDPTRSDLVEHKVPPCFVFEVLLYDRIRQINGVGSDDSFVVSLAPAARYTLHDFVMEVLGLEKKMTLLELRHFWTTLCNIVFPEGDSGVVVLTTDNLTARQSGHSGNTHSNRYGTVVLGGKELRFKIWHKALGWKESTSTMSPTANDTMTISLEHLQMTLRHIFGPQAEFRSESQRLMCWHITNSLHKNLFVPIGCGGGKSMAWLLRTICLLQKGYDPGCTIIILPYKFLTSHHFQSALVLASKFKRLHLRIEMLSLVSINADSLPT